MATPNPPWDRLFSEIKANIPGAIDAVIYQELWRVIEDFLNQTNVWVEEIPFAVEPNVLSYRVTPQSRGVIDRLLMVFDPANSAYDKRWTQQGIRFRPPETVVLMHSPSTAATWMAAVAKNISEEDLAGMPGQPDHPAHLPVLEDASWIVDRYRDAFRFGTLGYLMLQPTKPYSNPKLGAMNWQNYVAERGRCRTEILHENVYGGQKWMYPQGYATIARKGWT